MSGIRNEPEDSQISAAIGTKGRVVEADTVAAADAMVTEAIIDRIRIVWNLMC